MIFYYKVTDEKEGETWKLGSQAEFEEIKNLSAKHIGTTFISEEPNNNNAPLYEGDFWLDIDHTAPDAGSELVAIDRSIEDVRNIQLFLKVLGVDVNSCTLFISGGKGFHIRIPMVCFGGAKHAKLPRIYKEVATEFLSKTGASGIDPSMYNMSKGKLIRVENKQRKNGRYKVQIRWSDLDTLTPEAYFLLASAPGIGYPVTAPVVNKNMVKMFNAAQRCVTDTEKFESAPALDGEYMKIMEGGVTNCGRSLAQGTNFRSNVNFNSAKMTFVRYLAVSGLRQREKDLLIIEFSENFVRNSKATPRDTEAAVRSSMKFGEDGAANFSCKWIRGTLKEDVCSGCPVQETRAIKMCNSDRLKVVNGCYFNLNKQGELNASISRFTMKALEVSYEIDENGTERDMVFTTNIISNDPSVRTRVMDLSSDVFLSKTAIQKALKNLPMAEWTGSDNEVLYLRGVLTSNLEEVERVIRVKKLGVQRVIDNTRDEPIDEYVWVEDNWSMNKSGVAKTVKYRGMLQEGESSEMTSLTLKLEDVEAVETELSARALAAIFKSRDDMTMAVFFGWMASCWLKPMLQSQAYRDSFPLLHVYGEPGVGKSEASKALSIFAGNDGVNGSITSVNGNTAFFLKAEASTTTSVPRIIDEFNKQKIPAAKYLEVLDTLKMAGTKGSRGNGKVKEVGGSSKTVTEVTVMSSPIVYMGTVQTDDEELLQRSLVLELTKDGVLNDKSISQNFYFACEHKEELFRYAKMLMQYTIALTPEQLKEQWAKTSWVTNSEDPNHIKDHRKAKSLQCAHVGLEIAITAFKNAGCSQGTIQMIENMIPLIKEYRNHPSYRFLFETQFNESDRLVSRLVELTMVYDSKGEPLLKKGVHYTADSLHLHINIIASWHIVFKYYESMKFQVEFTTHKSFLTATAKSDYYKGTGIASGVAGVDYWHTFSIAGLHEKGISTSALQPK